MAGGRDPFAGQYTYSGAKPYVASLPSFPTPTPIPIPTAPIVIGLEPQAYDAILYGKVMPVFIGGRLLIGGRIIEGPYYSDGAGGDKLVDYVAYHAICADPTEARTVTEFRLRGQQAWTLSGGYLDTAKLPSGGFDSRTGTRTQAAFTQSIDRNGAGAIAYRDGIISSVRGVSLRAFGGIIPFPSIGIQDNAYASGIPRSIAIEKCLRYMRLADADFEVDVTGEDSAWIIGAQLTLQDFLQRLRSIFVHYNITYTDKIRIIEPTSFSIDHDLTGRNLLGGTTRFTKGDPLTVSRRQNYSFIDSERDNEPNVVVAQEDVYPQPSTSSVSEETIELPVVTTSAQATADNWVSFYEKMSANNQMEGAGLTSLFGMEVGDGLRFQGDSAINSFMDKAFRAAETQHTYDKWQVQFRGDEVLNCGVVSTCDPVPDNAVIFIDFICPQYWVEDVEYEQADVIGGTGTAEIVEDEGLLVDGENGSYPQGIGAFLTKWAELLTGDGLTIEVEFKPFDIGGEALVFGTLFLTDDVGSVRIFWCDRDDSGFSIGVRTSGVDGFWDTNVSPYVPDAVNKVAVTFIPDPAESGGGSLSISLNGGAVFTTPSGMKFTTVDALYIGHQYELAHKASRYIRKITVYEPVADEDLPGLSEL